MAPSCTSERFFTFALLRFRMTDLYTLGLQRRDKRVLCQRLLFPVARFFKGYVWRLTSSGPRITT